MYFYRVYLSFKPGILYMTLMLSRQLGRYLSCISARGRFARLKKFLSLVCALYFVFGVVCAFFGYRCFKAIMFLYGFIFGSIIVYLICAEEAVLPGKPISSVSDPRCFFADPDPKHCLSG